MMFNVHTMLYFGWFVLSVEEWILMLEYHLGLCILMQISGLDF
jgi:hypothetical protein